LAEALADGGAEVAAWAPDGSAGDTPFLRARAGLRRLTGPAEEALAGCGGIDIIHDNGIWLPHNHRLAVLAKRRGLPRVVSTRGMLEPWALAHKRWKKRAAWLLYQKRDLWTAAAVHATAETEALGLRRLGLPVPVGVVPNGVDLPAAGRGGAVGGTALFLGRLHPVKGLPMLAEAWRRVRPAGWRLRVVGPDEGGHRAEVEALVAAGGLGDVWSFEGELAGEAKTAVLAAASLLVLPTHTENFGMVVAEALAHGVPVITTKGAPWERLRSEGCGWWTDISADGLAAALTDATRLAPGELAAMGARGRRWMERDFSWQTVASGVRALYDRVLGR
jgi:glycosyltransferase involved in cell wall biosynthesis